MAARYDLQCLPSGLGELLNQPQELAAREPIAGWMGEDGLTTGGHNPTDRLFKGSPFARHMAGLDAPHPREQWARRMAGSLLLPLGGGVATAFGMVLCVSLAVHWGASDFGALNPEVAMRQIIPGVGLVILGTQSLLASMYFAALRSAFDSSRRAFADRS